MAVEEGRDGQESCFNGHSQRRTVETGMLSQKFAVCRTAALQSLEIVRLVRFQGF